MRPDVRLLAEEEVVLHAADLSGALSQTLRLQVPSGLLPAMELDGRLYVESAEIMRLLEEEFPDSAPLMPAVGSKERGRADALMRLERRLFSDWLSWLCQSW